MNLKIISLTCALNLITSLAFAATSPSQNTYDKKNSVSEKAGHLSQEHAARKTTADSQMTGTNNDVEITRKIRARLTDMEGLSTSAQNVTIVTKGKNVTISGEVEKEDEIRKILSTAQQVATGMSVTNKLTVEK